MIHREVIRNKTKVMYIVHNNISPSYLQELFHMRDVNLNNTAPCVLDLLRSIIILCLQQNVTYFRVVPANKNVLQTFIERFSLVLKTFGFLFVFLGILWNF